MKKTSSKLQTVWRLCPVRCCVLLVSCVWLCVYFATRGNRAWMDLLCRVLVRPWHRMAGSFFSLVPFSVAEWLVAAGVVLLGLFLVQLIVHFVRRRDAKRLIPWAVTVLSLAAAVFGLFSLWWGVYYYADGFLENEGVSRRDISAAELQTVTEYFADLANEKSVLTARTEQLTFTSDEKALFDASETLYHPVEEIYPSLAGPELRAKPAFFSRIMSRINFTGYFFPLTAEANINVDSPLCLMPSTIAHELAHQRGVSGEDEANFVAVVACMESGDPDFQYSGALMAYIYLGNALYKADRSAWESVYGSLNSLVRADLNENNTYWKQFEDTPTSKASDIVYESFLQTYGEERGLQSYGECVDLLVLHYLPETAYREQ